MIFFWLLIGLLCCMWLVITFFSLRHSLRVDSLEQAEVPEIESPPLLSVVVCACNEEDTLADALETLTAQSYPNLQLVVVNDRSTDGTGRVLDDLAEKHPCIHPVHNHELPEGWLGKVWAQHQGAQQARGAYLLFTDADIHFEPDCLKLAMAQAIARDSDHLVVFPRLLGSGFLLRILLGAFQFLALARLHITANSRVAQGAFMGIGAFNMVRREALEACAGFPWLKMEVIDDIGLGLAMANAGFRTDILDGLSRVKVHWYPNLPAMAVGLEKNTYAALAAWRPHVGLSKLAVMTLLTLAPWIAFAHGGPLGVFGMTVLLARMLGSAVSARRWLQPVWAAPFVGVGMLLVIGIMLRAILLAHHRKGVYWRGTFYSLARLKAGQRVFFT